MTGQKYHTTTALIAVNVAIFFYGVMTGTQPELIATYAFSGEKVLAHRFDVFILSGFLHDGITHLTYNMLFLWIFGRTCEEVFGAAKTLGIYGAAMVLGSLFFAAVFPQEAAVGASGGVAGLIAAGMLVEPGRPVHADAPHLPVVLLAVAFILPTAINAFSLAENVANIAHIGGVFAGTILAFLWAPDRAENGAWAVIVFGAALLVLSMVQVFG